MATRKRFIAGAICPKCQSPDTLAVWRENDVDTVGCVKCGFTQRQTDQPLADNKRSDSENIIGIFHPD
ncbi:YheV family putative zinc ribbon protein [Acerihabitans sp. TG2]|uniref:YheV family putative zinc ribbon protein n=1 Tax=Acerihabitans sp. TG2 TaxID=3096008 RepID=UPI002B23932B|nr:YheV family putative zinc ribbon protein [Acerihabitans sp. TG2]MEA9390871.1 YheV family putative zinc ribbon protein [Acerihabitans sp. TG2]